MDLPSASSVNTCHDPHPFEVALAFHLQHRQRSPHIDFGTNRFGSVVDRARAKIRVHFRRFVVRSLPGPSSMEFRFDLSLQDRLFETPLWPDQILRWCVPADPFDDRCRWNSFQKIDDGVDVFVLFHQPQLSGRDVVRQRRPLNDVQVVEFDGVESQPRDLFGRLHHHRVCFVGNSQDDVGTAFETTIPASIDRVDHVFVMMSPVHPIQAWLMHGLHAVFDRDVVVGRQRFGEAKHAIGNTIGPRADRQTDDIGMPIECQPIDLFQLIDRRVGVGRGLKVRQETLDLFVPSAQTFDAALELFADTFEPHAARGTEGSVVAKIAAASGNRAINIGTREPRIDTNSLDSPAETTAECGPERVEYQTLALPGQTIVRIRNCQKVTVAK